MRVAVLGVGLIGGSIGLASARRLGAEVSGYDRDPEVLARARERGAIQEPAASVSEAVAGAELAFVAVPVGVLGETVDQVLADAPADCLVTDAGSTKHAVVAAHSDQRY